MNWNLIIGIGLLYLGTGIGYSQWVLDRFVKYRKVDKGFINYLLWEFYKPIINFRMKYDV